MATSGPTPSLQNLQSNADFQAFVQAIAANLAACGLTQTADTGQIDPTTVARPAVATPAGYQMWRFNDALQATRPVFVKVEYGVGGATDRPALWVTVGTGTNGAGTLTGQVTTRVNLAQLSSAAVGATGNIYASGGDGRFWCSTPVTDSSNLFAWFGVERGRDADGTPANTAVMFYAQTSGSSATFQMIPGDGSNPFTLTALGRSPGQIGKGLIGSDIAVDPWVFFYGKPVYGLAAMMAQGAMGFASTFAASVLGAQHTFIVFGGVSATLLASTTVPALPWE